MPMKAIPQHSSDRPVHALAIVAQPDAATDALAEMIRAHELHASTAAALQRRINALEELKAKRSKTNGAAVRRTEDELATAVVGDQFVQHADAVKRVTTSYEVGATPSPADVKIIMAHSIEARTRFLAWQAAIKAKKQDARRFNDRIAEVRDVLSKLLLKGAESKVEPAQQTIPGVEADAPEPEGWATKTVKRVIVETFAHEVKRADHEARQAATAGDDVAERIARTRAAERQRFLDELAAAGFTAEPESPDEITSLELDFELADEAVIEIGDEEEDADDGEDEPPAAGASPEPEPEDPTKHPALAGAISATKAKRAAKKTKAGGKPKGRGRGKK